MSPTAEGLDADIEAFPSLVRPRFCWRVVVVLSVLMVMVTATSELTWPFINQMIVDIGAAPDPQSVGFYSGLIETVASFFGFATIFPGSVAANRWGRKPVICATLLGTAVGQACFGTSNTLFGLITCRSVIYALGPQLAWSLTVTVLGDLSDDSRHGAAVSAVNASYRLGQLISPLFAAALAHPADRYDRFRSHFWRAFPYALPCLAGGMLCVGGLYMIIYYLAETAPGLYCAPGAEGPKVSYGSIDTTGVSGTVQAAMAVAQDETAPAEMITATLEPVAHIAAGKPGALPYTPRVAQLLVSSWIMYFIMTSLSTIFPLWAFTPIANGGLGATEDMIGVYISARAIIQFFSLAPFAYFEGRIGVYGLYAYSLTGYALISTLSFPLLNFMAQTTGTSSIWMNIALGIQFLVLGLGNYCTTCMVMMINQAAPSPQALSQLVGVSQAVLGIGQCMAPIVTLSMFEFSIKSDLLAGNAVWVFLFALSLIASAHSFSLENTVDME